MILGKKGGSTGLKRKPAPRFWPIHRKEFTWVVKPEAGPHSLGRCMPLALVLRDVLGIANTRKEAKMIIGQGKVCVDGVARREDDFPVGLMDAISIPEVEKHFLILPSYKGFVLKPVDKKETEFKLCRIEDKKVIMKGHVQLNLHDGSNLLVKVADPKNPQEDAFETIDTIQISIPERQVIGHIAMKENDYAIITGGKNMGVNGKIVEIEKAKGKKRRNALVTIEDSKGNRYQTILDFVFAVGETQPLVTMTEAVQVV
jgi:small subunit ribosomal protein S4e